MTVHKLSVSEKNLKSDYSAGPYTEQSPGPDLINYCLSEPALLFRIPSPSVQ